MLRRRHGQGTTRARTKRFRISPADLSPPGRVALIWGLALFLSSFGLTACDTRSFERSSDGSKIFLDELSDAAKSEARQKIVVSLVKGTQAFYLEVGDEVDIFFNVNRRPTPGEYVIRVGDQLRIEFLSESDNARTVTVRPDGRISLPLIGPMVATGHTADALARQLQERYRGVIAGAQITVNVTETHSPLQDFLDMLGATSKGRSITDKVLPDGTIAVPLLPPLKARGRTLTELQNEINASYAARGLNLFVSLVPRALHSGSTYVLGEVAKPGRFDLERPRTVMMAIAQAGGINTSGSPSSVRVFYVGADGEPRVRSINLNEVMNDLKLEQDMIVPDNSIIYVPTSELAQAGRLMDAVVRDILRFNGTALGLGLNLDNQSVSNPAFNPH